jgi:hypothetical protein
MMNIVRTKEMKDMIDLTTIELHHILNGLTELLKSHRYTRQSQHHEMILALMDRLEDEYIKSGTQQEEKLYQYGDNWITLDQLKAIEYDPS